jgi:hypothetical protein
MNVPEVSFGNAESASRVSSNEKENGKENKKKKEKECKAYSQAIMT